MTGMLSAVRRRLFVRGPVTVGPRFHLGPRSRVWAPTHLEIGRDVYVGKNVTIEVDGAIGDGVLIANNVGIVGRRDHDSQQIGAIIRRAVWVGDDPARLSSPVTIDSDVWIGFGAVILSGIRIGTSAIVAAGATVTKDVPPNAVVAGCPARVVATRFPAASFSDHLEALRRDGYALSSATAVMRDQDN